MAERRGDGGAESDSSSIDYSDEDGLRSHLGHDDGSSGVGGGRCRVLGDARGGADSGGFGRGRQAVNGDYVSDHNRVSGLKSQKRGRGGLGHNTRGD